MAVEAGLRVRPAPAPHAGYDGAKRALDVLGAGAMLLLAAPVMLVAALAILLTSGRPILHRGRRIGHGGREFTCLKFRSMENGAEARRAELEYLNTTAGPTFKHPADPRVTRVGRPLRKLSIDELPQLINVLRGEMSLVGPRPLPVAENVYSGEQELRLSVKPGLTCIWQVSGRSDIPFERWMEMDLEYVRGRSLARDAQLLLQTPWVLISGRGAS
jgi:lipopolysaccharide/colanic/teichoic acid biosynthesis glycosyltransferase